MANLSMYQIYQYLPKTDCKKCGFSCMEFANHMIAESARPEDCPFLLEPEYAETLMKLHELLGPEVEKEVAGIFLIDQDKCNGCGICTIVCEINIEKSQEVEFGRAPSYRDNVVLRVDNGKVKLADLESCRRLDPSGPICRACVELCPTKALSFV